MEKPNAVVVGTPTTDGGICQINYAASMATLGVALLAENIGFSMTSISNDSIITHARNSIANAFMEQSNADYLMFIDSDIGFNPYDVVKMLCSGKDLIGIAFPKKEINWSGVVRAVESGKAIPNPETGVIDLSRYSGDFAVVFEESSIFKANEPIPCKRVGFAMIAISRNLFEKIQPSLDTYIDHDGKTKYEYFRIDKSNDGHVMSETYSFCDHVRKQGFQPYIAPWVNVTHRGSYDFSGSFLSLLSVS